MIECDEQILFAVHFCIKKNPQSSELVGHAYDLLVNRKYEHLKDPEDILKRLFVALEGIALANNVETIKVSNNIKEKTILVNLGYDSDKKSGIHVKKNNQSNK